MDLNKTEKEIWDDSQTLDEFLLRCKVKDGVSNTEYNKLLDEFEAKIAKKEVEENAKNKD